MLSESGPAATALEARVQELGGGVAARGAGARHTKKALGIFSQKNVVQVYAVIARLQEERFATAMLCEVLDVHRSRFYVWQQGSQGCRAREDAELKTLIREIFWEHKRRYGARRIAREMSARDQRCGVARVGRLLHEMGLKAIQPKSFQPRTTDSRHSLGFNPNCC